MAGTDGWTNLHDNDSAPVDYRGAIVLPSGGARGSSGGSGGTGADGLNMPSKPTTQGALGANTQAGRRWPATLFDVHRTGPGGRFPNGRPWTGQMELPANPDMKHDPGFVGGGDLSQGEFVADEAGNVDRRSTFASVWNAPWVPTIKYFVFNYKRRLITFQYDRFKSDEQRAMDTYYEAAAKMGAGMHLAVEYGQVPPYAITGVMGSPMPYIRNMKIADAAMARDPWLLGFIDEPNAELAKLLGYNERTGLRQLSYNPEPKQVVTPEAVLATPQNEIAKMIADAVAKALADERARQEQKSDADKARMAKVRAKRKSPSNPAKEPA